MKILGMQDFLDMDSKQKHRNCF